MLLGDQRSAATAATSTSLSFPQTDADYAEVELRLRAALAGATAAELRVDGRALPETVVTLDAPALDAVGPDPAAYGIALGRQLLAGTSLGQQVAEMRAAFASQGRRWRLRLRLDDDALRTLRWERLHLPTGKDGWTPVGSDAETPFSRYAYADWEAKQPLVGRPIRTLLVIASPEGLDDYGMPPIPEADRAAIRDALAAAGADEVDVRELASGARAPTLDALRTALTQAPAVVHVLCHGTAGPDGTALFLEGPGGKAEPVSAADILDAMRGADPRPRLVVLSACDSAAAGDRRAFLSLGPALADEGIDAVVAMTDRVSADTARQFSTHFYSRLLAHGIADRAMNEARAAVRGAWDWSVPVLFSRLADAQLIDFPVGRVDTRYLDVSGRLARRAAEVRDRGMRDGAAQEAVNALDALVHELEKSHEILTTWAGRYRRTGADPATFRDTFGAFYLDFKEYYDNKTFRKERTRCGDVDIYAHRAMPLLNDVLTDEEKGQLHEDLNRIVGADGTIIEQLAEFLETMNREVDQVHAALTANDVAGAIARKQAFEMQLSPTFRRSKELLGDIGERAHRVSAA